MLHQFRIVNVRVDWANIVLTVAGLISFWLGVSLLNILDLVLQMRSLLRLLHFN